MEIFPLSISLRKFWTIWELRILILVSVCLQIILTLFGSRRKQIRRIWIRIVVWLAYIAADPVAIVALGSMAGISPPDFESGQPEARTLVLFPLWAAVVLVHLGGPDNITAYSLEDNELWLRHLLQLAIQVAVASYVFLSSWTSSVYSYIAIPLVLTGLVKYGERMLVLWSLSTERFIASSERDPCPKFVTKAMERKRKLQGKDSYQLYNAFFLFTRFARLFAGLVLHDKEAKKSYQIFDRKTAGDAFYLVAVELNIVYDMLYTKASVVFSKLGIIIRCLNFSCFVLVIVVLSCTNVNQFTTTDISITYLLLVVAVTVELCGFVRHIFSDWTKLCFTKSESIRRTTFDTICSSYPVFTNQKRWSEAMGQFNLVSYCIKDMPSTCSNKVLKLFSIKKFMNQYVTWVDVSDGLREMIFDKLKEKIGGNMTDALRSDIEWRRRLLAQRGEKVLRDSYHFEDKFNWCTTDAEFEYGLLVWHVATSLCYYEDTDKDERPSRQNGKWLSDYMLYLLVLCPSIMPKGIGELRFKATCTNLTILFDNHWFEVSHDPSEASKVLFRKEVATYTNTSKKDDDLSVLNGGCYLAQQLQSLELGYEEKWKMISEVWVEMLTYAADQSGWREHIEQLKNGGELLTHVRLLMAHLGLCEQYRSYGREIP